MHVLFDTLLACIVARNIFVAVAAAGAEEAQAAAPHVTQYALALINIRVNLHGHTAVSPSCSNGLPHGAPLT